ncbi:hypothetical protein EE612_002590 [Oryza sativa]|nr:hypothetical protein EE612_002590 [Oryza sativa]
MRRRRRGGRAPTRVGSRRQRVRTTALRGTAWPARRRQGGPCLGFLCFGGSRHRRIRTPVDGIWSFW